MSDVLQCCTASCCFLAAATVALILLLWHLSQLSLCVFFRSCILPLHPYRRVEKPDRCAVHATDWAHGGGLQGPGLHPGSWGSQRAEPEGERHHLSELGRPTQSCRTQLRLGWVKHVSHVSVVIRKMRYITHLCGESSVLFLLNIERADRSGSDTQQPPRSWNDSVDVEACTCLQYHHLFLAAKQTLKASTWVKPPWCNSQNSWIFSTGTPSYVSLAKSLMSVVNHTCFGWFDLLRLRHTKQTSKN